MLADSASASSLLSDWLWSFQLKKQNYLIWQISFVFYELTSLRFSVFHLSKSTSSMKKEFDLLFLKMFEFKVLYFLWLCPIFVGPMMHISVFKVQKLLSIHSFFYKNRTPQLGTPQSPDPKLFLFTAWSRKIYIIYIIYITYIISFCFLKSILMAIFLKSFFTL